MQKRLVSAVYLALNTFNAAMNTTHSTKVIAETPTPEEMEALLLQGGALAKVNKAREVAGKHPMSAPFNVKVVDKDWAEALLSGEGVAVAVEQSRVKQPLTEHIQQAIEYTIEKHPLVKFHKVENARFVSLLLYIETAEEKKSAKSQKETKEETKGQS